MLSIRLFVLIVLSCSYKITSGWLYQLPEGSCTSFSSCQDCVVEYAIDTPVRRPCTWCPATNTCEVMNHYTGFCDTGQTFRDICPIEATDLPRCVDLHYSFWICGNARPRNRSDGECGASFTDGFCSAQRTDRVVTVCNGDTLNLETVDTVGFGRQNALSVAKNAYGLEINVIYFWLNAGAGEDRRRIETIFSDTDGSFTYLCNAQMNPDQAIVAGYRVEPEGNSEDSSEESVDSDEGHATSISSTAVTSFLVFGTLSTFL